MSFDSHSLERLRELGRKLPNPLPVPNTKSSKANQNTKAKLHPIETLSQVDANQNVSKSKKASRNLKLPKDELYISFERLLLEEDD